LKKKFLSSPLFTQSWDCLGWKEQGLALQHSSNTYNQSTGEKTQTQTNKPNHWKKTTNTNKQTKALEKKHKHKKHQSPKEEQQTKASNFNSKAQTWGRSTNSIGQERGRTTLGKKHEQHWARWRTKNNGEEGGLGEEGGPRTMGKN